MSAYSNKARQSIWWHCGGAVMTMQLSAAGLPLAAMSDGTAHVWHVGMEAWMRVADGAFPASPFHSLLQPPAGETPGPILP